LAYGRHVHEYQKGAVNGASPLQLVIMLYDGALRFLEAGKHAMVRGEIAKQNDNLQRAQKIVVELMSCLDMKQGGDVAKNLLALYTYVLNELVMANIQDKPEPVERCIKVLSDLRESWAQVERQMKVAPMEEEQRLAA
jgi:flagellar secretion chaperone FliS